ncbi:MAG TPA: WXG100 family type VII secretion target [Clostridiaceae bacterium]|nr:WXG100 family type VII secretion target [Clostridiaceae bacterium]
MAESPYYGAVESINTDLFDDTINAFRAAINQYRTARERVFVSTDKLVSVWEGEGQESFEAAYRILKTRLNDEEDNLRTIAENLEDMRQSYRDWDNALAQQFNNSK